MSRHSVFLVIATFIYLFWSLPFGPSFIEGMLFLIFGVFLIPLIVGLPLNFVKAAAMYGTGSGMLVSGIDKIGLFLVFLLTNQAYVYMFDDLDTSTNNPTRYSFFKNSTPEKTSVEMGEKLISIVGPDNFVNIKNISKVPSELLKAQDSVEKGFTLAYYGIEQDDVHLLTERYSKSMRSPTIARLTYEDGIKTVKVTPKMLYKIMDLYKSEALDAATPKEYSMPGVNITDKDLYVERTKHPVYFMRISESIRKIKKNQHTIKLVIASSLIILNDRLFALTVQRNFNSKADIEAIVKISNKWADKLQRYNKTVAQTPQNF